MVTTILPFIRQAEQLAFEQAVVVFARSLSATTLVRPLQVRAAPATICGIVSAIADSMPTPSGGPKQLLFEQFARAYGIDVAVQQDRDTVDVVVRLWSAESHGVLGFNGRGKCVLRCNRSGKASPSRAELQSIKDTPLFEEARRKAIAWLSL